MKWMDKFKELSGGVKLALIVPGTITALFTFWVQFIYPDFDTFKKYSSVEVHVHLNSNHIEPHWTTYRVPCDPYTVTHYINACPAPDHLILPFSPYLCPNS